MGKAAKKIRNKLVLGVLIFSAYLPALVGASESTAKQAVAAVSDGPPAHRDVLGDQSFLPVKLRQLANAQLWYVRYDSLRKRGFKIPPAGIADPAFAKWYLNRFAYQNPGPGDAPENFTSKTKTAYADYYGGEGNHGVRGSGRATLNGDHQHKGNLTPMVPEENRDPNMNGAQQIIDSMEEAVWSEILDNEFKYGANETLDVIFTGNYARHSSGQIFPRGLQGRHFAVRMAHFMLRPGPVDSQDMARVKSIMPNLINALPYPPSGQPSNPGEALRTGLLEFTYREAYTQAEYYAKRIYFGSDSPSNVTIDGQRKDLTAHSAFLGYSRVYRPIADGLIPFGTIDEALLTFKELQESLSKTLPSDLLPYLPSQDEFVQFFKKTYASQLKIEMMKLTGMPTEFIDDLKSTKEFNDLAKVVLKISREGNTSNVLLDMDAINYTDRYQLKTILKVLGAKASLSSQALEQVLTKWIPDNEALKAELANAYAAFHSKLRVKARAAGLSDRALETYIKEASKVRNQDRKDLVYGNARIREFWRTADAAISSKDGTVVERFIQKLVDENTFNYKDASPFQVVLSQTRKPSEGLSARRIYDAKTGEYGTLVRLNAVDGSVYVNGTRESAKDLASKQLEYKGETAPAKRSGDYVEFFLKDADNIDLGKIKFDRKAASIPATSKASRSAPIARSCKALFAI